jgi:hypothetical protein
MGGRSAIYLKGRNLIMRILYMSDNEARTIMPLATLIANFDMTGGWQFRSNESDMRHELESRGWYEGLHDCGRYLVLNLAKLDLEPIPEARVSTSWGDIAKRATEGTRVRFVCEWDIYPYGIVPHGMTGTVTETDADSVWILADDSAVRDMLREWEGNVQLHGLVADDESPIEIL